MKYLILLLIGANVSYGQQFNGTIIDYNTGNIEKIITGSIAQTDITKSTRENIEAYHRMNVELEASIAASRQEYELQQQTRELREQTRLLRQLANE